MARSRRLASRSVLLTLLAGAVATSILTGLIALSNNVVNLRREIDVLQSEREYLEALTALSTRRWNEVSSREVVVARAEKELGLVAQDGPGTVIVFAGEALPRQMSPWWRILGTVGGGGDRIQTASAQSR